ncbi:MAG: hypothetical protein IIX56_03020 [Treponema sp.]|nr:hypothetical protein [Treponema sp.]MBQ2234363.1 hypothetical protein [Treponema sp.]
MEESKELVQTEINEIKEEQYGAVISQQVNKIKEIEDKIKSAKTAAKTAKEDAEKLNVKKIGFLKKRFATKSEIEKTQAATKNNANAISEVVTAQEKLFEYQKEITEATKFLYALGARSLAANRRVMDQVLMEIEGLSDEETAAAVEEELNKVLDELREQQDILKKQEELENKAKLNHDSITDIEKVTERQSEKISSIYDTLSEKEKIDAEQNQRLDEVSAILDETSNVAKNHELAITENRQAIDKNSEAIKILLEYTKQKDILDKEQSNEIELLRKSKANVLSIIAICLSGISLFVSIILKFI